MEKTGVLAKTMQYIESLGFSDASVTSVHIGPEYVEVGVVEMDHLGNPVMLGDLLSVRTYRLPNVYDPEEPEEAEIVEEEQENE